MDKSSQKFDEFDLNIDDDFENEEGEDLEQEENQEEAEDFEEEENDDDEEHDENGSISNEMIITALSNFVSENGHQDEDIASYKSKMKGLLEQLMSKLEEDVDYQRNLELQIEELERDVQQKDILIERLSRSAKDSIDDCKTQTDELVEELMSKIKHERKKRSTLEKMILRLQNDNAQLQSDLRIQKMKTISHTTSHKSKSPRVMIKSPPSSTKTPFQELLPSSTYEPIVKSSRTHDGTESNLSHTNSNDDSHTYHTDKAPSVDHTINTMNIQEELENTKNEVKLLQKKLQEVELRREVEMKSMLTVAEKLQQSLNDYKISTVYNTPSSKC